MLGRAAVVVFLVAALGVAVFAYQSMRAPLDQPGAGSTPSSLACTPSPCVDVQGFTLWVSNLSVDGNVVKMTVKFKNSSDATHASPDDLTLVDRSNHTARITTSAGSDCNTWARHEFNNGQEFGPVDICFQVNDPTPPFVLRWTPDMGLFCCETGLPLGLPQP